MALNNCHVKLHIKQISKTEEGAMFMPAYFLILQSSEAFAQMQVNANVQVKVLQWGPVGGWES